MTKGLGGVVSKKAPVAQEEARDQWTWPAAPIAEWGPRGWRWLHVTAINYAQHPSMAEGRIVFRRIWNFIANLPCADCRAHGLLYVIRNPPDLSNSDALQKWMCAFHNAVNVRLHKPVVPFEEYRGAYADEICWAHWGRGCDTMNALRSSR